ncbi:Uncharacterized protein PBTT_10125 [Plasmodiophora brassicae]|uniref:Uncharacterized protein n=1 Tax=Plasmodiophora brassicae TaxID=37360 RepID=A0A0G4INZ2_PLABS|nr:hypothetical protein PBRA_005509 [Plasmodiophora brassicae]
MSQQLAMLDADYVGHRSRMPMYAAAVYAFDLAVCLGVLAQKESSCHAFLNYYRALLVLTAFRDTVSLGWVLPLLVKSTERGHDDTGIFPPTMLSWLHRCTWVSLALLLYGWFTEPDTCRMMSPVIYWFTRVELLLVVPACITGMSFAVVYLCITLQNSNLDLGLPRSPSAAQQSLNQDA